MEVPTEIEKAMDIKDILEKNIAEAKQMLQDQKACFVFLKEGEPPQISTESGVRPLMIRLRDDLSAFEKGVIADKVFGRAAALLAVLGKTSAVYGEVMSQAGVQILEMYHIPYQYGTLVPFIQNRKYTGKCPLEETVWEIEDPKQAFPRLEQKIQQLMNKK
jgi:hypothetical protein